MENNVTTIIMERVESLLLEGRLEEVKDKYPEPMWDEIDKLASIDPSGNQKYLEWLVKNSLNRTIKWFKDHASERAGYYGWSIDQVPNTSTDPRWTNMPNLRRAMQTLNHSDFLKVTDDIEYFHKNPSKYEKKDINLFTSLNDLEEATNQAKLKLSRKEQKETGVDKVYEDDDFLVLMPKTHKASCRYGSNTRWCVTMRDRSGYYENYFSQGPIFFLIDKRKIAPTKSMDTPNYYKIAMHYRPFNGGLYRGSNRGMQLASGKSKEEFVDGGSIQNATIDYWNVADDKKNESVVKKFLGGPGRGQTQKGEEAISKLKSVMEKYTKEVLAKFYDSIGDNTELLNKVTEKENELSTKVSEIRNMDNKRSRINNIIYELNNAGYEFSGDEEEMQWIQSQKSQGEIYINQLISKTQKAQEEETKLREELTKLRAELQSKELVFYDPKKNVSLG